MQLTPATIGKRRPLPRSPVLDWSNFRIVEGHGIGSVERLPHRAYTTSGRGAIYHALLQLRLPPGATVLVPSYHCPTMVAPVLMADMQVAFFGLRADGLPRLDSIDADTADKTQVMLVAHYFGLAQSLAETRAWCDARGIALIEDCAHCYFGAAGDRPVGAWGDYATASLSKFFPVPEAGLLASASRPIDRLKLEPPTWKSQLKGLVDVVESSVVHQRLAGMRTALGWLFKAKNWRRRPPSAEQPPSSMAPSVERLMRECDMSRIGEAPLLASMMLKWTLPRSRIVARRRRNFELYAECLAEARGRVRPLFPSPTNAAVPYVYPLWVDDADRIYEALRAQALPVFRWDRVWPGVPTMTGDVGPSWSRHVLQLLCHQDLDEHDIRRTAAAVVALTQGAASASVPAD